MANPPTDLRNSEVFPPGHGDIRLISSDRVALSFHRWLLAYVSPVFHDMFKLDETKERDSHEVALQEESRILTLLFQFIDPMQDKPDLDFQVLPQLLEVGRKYQIDEIRKQATSWLTNNCSTVEDETTKLSTAQSIELLERGITYEMPRLCQLALRNLIKTPAREIFVSRLSTSELFEHLMELRRRRIRCFQKNLSLILGAGAANSLLNDGEFVMEDKSYMMICKSIVTLTFEVGLEPSLACCLRNWAEILKSDYISFSTKHLNDFKELCEDLEAKLPDLSKGFGI